MMLLSSAYSPQCCVNSPHIVEQKNNALGILLPNLSVFQRISPLPQPTLILPCLVAFLVGHYGVALLSFRVLALLDKENHDFHTRNQKHVLLVFEFFIYGTLWYFMITLWY